MWQTYTVVTEAGKVVQTWRGTVVDMEKMVSLAPTMGSMPRALLSLLNAVLLF